MPDATPAPVAHTPGPIHYSEESSSIQSQGTQLNGRLRGAAQTDWCYPNIIANMIKNWDEAGNARLLAAAYTSYDKHCADPIAAAEGDLLGNVIREAAFLLDRLYDFEQAITSETDAGEFDGHVKPSVSRLSDILSRAGKLKGADHD